MSERRRGSCGQVTVVALTGPQLGGEVDVIRLGLETSETQELDHPQLPTITGNRRHGPRAETEGHIAPVQDLGHLRQHPTEHLEVLVRPVTGPEPLPDRSLEVELDPFHTGLAVRHQDPEVLGREVDRLDIGVEVRLPGEILDHRHTAPATVEGPKAGEAIGTVVLALAPAVLDRHRVGPGVGRREFPTGLEIDEGEPESSERLEGRGRHQDPSSDVAEGSSRPIATEVDERPGIPRVAHLSGCRHRSHSSKIERPAAAVSRTLPQTDVNRQRYCRFSYLLATFVVVTS